MMVFIYMLWWNKMFLQFVLSFETPAENSDLHTGKSMYLLIVDNPLKQKGDNCQEVFVE